MSERGWFRLAGVIGVSLVLIISITSYFGNKNVKIEAERIEAVRQIQREEEAIVQAQKTERTEERSQFWQKVVPWGSDETESNGTEIPTSTN